MTHTPTISEWFRRFPPQAIPVTDVWQRLGHELPVEQAPCPDCSSLADVHIAPEGGHWITCTSSRCAWAGDHLEYYQARTGISDIVTAIAMLRTKDGISGAHAQPAILRSYQKCLQTRKRFHDLRTLMRARQPIPSRGDAFFILGLQTTHHDPYWWHTTPAELDALLGNDAHPSAAEHRRLGLPYLDDLCVSAIAVPTYDVIDRLTGLWAATQGTPFGNTPDLTWYWRGFTAPCGGIGFRGSIGNHIPIWGAAGLIVSQPTAAVRLQAERLAHGSDLAPIALVAPQSYPASIAAMLPQRPWVVAIPHRIDKDTARLFHVARLVHGRVRLINPEHAIALTVDWTADNIIGRAGNWEEKLGELLESQPPGQRIAAFLKALEWSPALVTRCRRFWSASACRVVRESQIDIDPVREVVVSARLTVIDTPAGWFWKQTGELLANAVPDQLVGYLDAQGNVRHRGVIRYDNHIIPFDTDGFRTQHAHGEAAAAIERALLAAGHSGRIYFHPRIVRHIVDVARHFSEADNLC